MKLIDMKKLFTISFFTLPVRCTVLKVFILIFSKPLHQQQQQNKSNQTWLVVLLSFQVLQEQVNLPF